jgi:hypothetical protein
VHDPERLVVSLISRDGATDSGRLHLVELDLEQPHQIA